MAAEVTIPIALTARIPDGQPVVGEIGSITVPVCDGALHEADLRAVLADFLAEVANAYRGTAT